MTGTHDVNLGRGVNRLLRPLGLQVNRTYSRTDHKQFLPFSATIAAAREKGLSVGDYVDQRYNVAGATQETIDRIAQLSVFSEQVKTAVEIGPGSGRYLEKVLRLCSPERYEIYETASPWAEYLTSTYNVVRQPTDGWSLRSTENSSADLVQAYKVFVVTTFLSTCHYWQEMLRVARHGAYIIFDVMTEECLDPQTLDQWLEPKRDYGIYPTILPRNYTIEFFTSRQASLIGSFQIPMRPGRTETFVFRS